MNIEFPTQKSRLDSDDNDISHLLKPALRLSHTTATMAEQLVLRGTLEGHSGWVTSLATSLEK